MATTVAGPALKEKLTRIWETEPGFLGALASVDHKAIGKRYLVTAFVFLILGGLEALVMRVQLAHGQLGFLTPEEYDQLFTVHGVTMIFLYASPILSGFSNYLWPLMLGSRDMAYPRMNALSYWIFLFSGVFLYSSFLVGQPPDGGWFAYVPLTGSAFSPGVALDFYALGLTFLGISTTVGAVNFIVTFVRTRAPGMSLDRLPIFMYGTLTVSVSILFAMPPLTVACTFLFFDRRFGTHFFDAALGGSPMLWQHLFWIFGHPWVYIVVLPAMGMVSDILPAFCRRPLVGYTFVALATVSTGILGFGVWVHHMFATGLPTMTLSFFSAASTIITIPSAVAVFAWLATIWYGRPWFTTSFLFMAGFVVLFVIGGVSGVMTAAVPFDWQLTDSYFVVAHLHYVLVGINLFPVIGGLYYWFPKMTGRMLSEQLGKWNFWTMFVGLNVLFFPMHILGMLGMPRRIYTYPVGLGWDTWNLVETLGSFLFALGVLLFIVNVFWSRLAGERAGANPWKGPTLEWATPSPPPPYNFAVLPAVASRHPLWEEELLGEQRSRIHEGPVLDDGRQTLGTSTLDAQPLGVLQMPGDSYWPLLLALAITGFFYGAILGWAWLMIAGAAGALVTVTGWLWPRGLAVWIKGKGSTAWWGMVLFMVNEASFFAYLLFSYLYLSSLATGAWPTTEKPELTLALPNTLLLLVSSGTMWWADRAIKKGRAGRLKVGLLVTFVLGAVFLVVQGIEYASKPFPIGKDAYSSLFYVITGFHGAHVAVGLLMNLVVQLWVWRGLVTAERRQAVTNVAWYWHFVDVVWLVVFATLYLSPYLGLR